MIIANRGKKRFWRKWKVFGKEDRQPSSPTPSLSSVAGGDWLWKSKESNPWESHINFFPSRFLLVLTWIYFYMKSGNSSSFFLLYVLQSCIYKQCDGQTPECGITGCFLGSAWMQNVWLFFSAHAASSFVCFPLRHEFFGSRISAQFTASMSVLQTKEDS